MTRNNCEIVRREMDEADLNQQLTGATMQHLNACAECRSFNDERRGLRSLMAGLETVAAPADFDFRLRARLARDNDRGSGVFALGGLSIGVRSLAAVALVLLVAVAGIIVRNRLSSNAPATAGVNGPGPTPEKEIKATVPPSPNKREVAVDSKGVATVGPSTEPRQRRAGSVPENSGQRSSRAVAQNKGRVATRESSVLFSTVVTPKEPTDAGPLVRVPIDAPSLRFSVADGRGSSRTILLPAVSFGSQRVLGRGASFVPTSATKGAW